MRTARQLAAEIAADLERQMTTATDRFEKALALFAEHLGAEFRALEARLAALESHKQ
jgi:hypothetical protein